jgi:hypothetical protein
MTLILFLSVLSPLNTNYCLGPDSSLLPSLWLCDCAMPDSLQSRGSYAFCSAIF